MALVYGSVCSGVEAATQAWHPLGWRPAFFSEIDPFPSAVLAHHYPEVPNLGDMTRFKEWPDAALDLLVGGTPCQSFSVAGLRKGLDDPRGSLMLTYLAIARRYRPRWLVWENVPGVLSADRGRAFGALLGGMAELGYGFAYRILDAQYVRTLSVPFAVPQRRRRVFVVGHLGDWRPAASVLFDRESLSGNSPPRRAEWQATANTFEVGDNSGGIADLKRRAQAFVQNSRDEVRLMGGDGFIVGALAAEPGAKQQCYVMMERGRNGGQSLETRADGTANAILTPNGGRGGMGVGAIAHGWQVRRLTPIECERLQGFPDDFTRIPYRGRPAEVCPDGPRYKAMGNSMAVNVMQWIGERISLIDPASASAPSFAGASSNPLSSASPSADRAARRAASV